MLTYSAKREPNKCTDDHRTNTFASTEALALSRIR